MPSLSTPAIKLSRVGLTVQRQLKKLGINTVNDLLLHYPSRYEDYSCLIPISRLSASKAVTVCGRIELIANKRSPVKRTIVTEALVADKTGAIKVVWFNQPFLIRNLKIGDNIFLSGKIDADYYGMQMTSPAYEKIASSSQRGSGTSSAQETTHTARIVPVYPVTEKLTQKQLRFLIKTSLPAIKEITDWLPMEIKKELNLIDLTTALKQIHFPDSLTQLQSAQQRLKFDELFLLQLQARQIKHLVQNQPAYSIGFNQTSTQKFIRQLPFKLTSDQRKAAWDILRDMEKTHPMNRLLEGDVGSGKTVVAAIAILNTVINGYQAALMAPTEILAQQHFETLKMLFKDWDINIGLLTRRFRQENKKTKKQENKNDKTNLNGQTISQKDKAMLASRQGWLASPFLTEGARQGGPCPYGELLEKIQKNEIQIVVGTHALVEEKVQFAQLGLAIVDEQHRFGVEQRTKLRNNVIPSEAEGKSHYPHFLSLTATPIPRSLSLILYGELDVSLIQEMPQGRQKILTYLVPPEKRNKAYNFIRQEINKGRQVFVICPLINPSDKLGFKSVTAEYEKLTKNIFPDLKIAVMHGRLKAAEKKKIMEDTRENKINILISTSVIEVGIDIPNATIMMIEGADRFGLAQLHQFRGRVGRSEHKSYCLLFTENAGQKGLERLRYLEQTNNGFELAEKDLQMRGPGEVYGTLQSGLPDLKIATLGDVELLKTARKQAERVMDLEKYPLIQEKLKSLNKKYLE
ncbi:MAG: ATP-dependent DNA helicase RecG [Candidatus Doudnabacteria bacterium]|nr:ATP-dependent DNA helicase RecG [Candidatus Doudnabacteria bacterium]